MYSGNMQANDGSTVMFAGVACVCVLLLVSSVYAYMNKCEWLGMCDEPASYADTSSSIIAVDDGTETGDATVASDPYNAPLESTETWGGGLTGTAKKTGGACDSYKKDRRVSGPVLKSGIKNVAKWQECCKICGKTKGCTAWQHNLELEKCNLYGGKDGGNQYEKTSTLNVYRSFIHSGSKPKK